MKMNLSEGVLMEHPVFCSISTDSFFLLHIHRALKRCTMWFLFFPCNKWQHSPEKVHPKGYEQGGNKCWVDAGVVISNIDLGCVYEARFFSPHPMLYFCCTTCNSVFISLFVFIHWPPAQWLSKALGKIYFRATWCCWLFIVPIFSFIHRVWVVCSSPPFPCEIDGSFSFRNSTCGMTEVTLEVLQGQSALNTSIFQYWYKRELPVWVFTAKLGALRWETTPCSPRTVPVPEGAEPSQLCWTLW